MHPIVAAPGRVLLSIVLVSITGYKQPIVHGVTHAKRRTGNNSGEQQFICQLTSFLPGTIVWRNPSRGRGGNGHVERFS